MLPGWQRSWTTTTPLKGNFVGRLRQTSIGSGKSDAIGESVTGRACPSEDSGLGPMPEPERDQKRPSPEKRESKTYVSDYLAGIPAQFYGKNNDNNEETQDQAQCCGRNCSHQGILQQHDRYDYGHQRGHPLLVDGRNLQFQGKPKKYAVCGSNGSPASRRKGFEIRYAGNRSQDQWTRQRSGKCHHRLTAGGTARKVHRRCYAHPA